MKCSLNCFCDFLEAPSSERKKTVVRRYKKAASGEAKGRSVYYQPAIRAIRGQLCPGGTVEEITKAIVVASTSPKYKDSYNETRTGSNLRVFRIFRSVLGTSNLKPMTCKKLQCLASSNVAVNLQADLTFEADGALTLIKLGVTKKCRPDFVISYILQMFSRGAAAKGLKLPITRIHYLDTVSGKLYVEHTENPVLEDELSEACALLSQEWEGSSE